MAIVYRCDRCKTIGDAQDFLTDVLVPGTAAREVTGDKGKGMVGVDERRLGLCQDCLATLRLFMDNAA